MDRRLFLKTFLSATAATAAAPRTFASSPSVYDTIIIGAGLSGLNAALTLQDMGLRPLVLEGSSRVGGRVFTKRGDGWAVEVGGQEIGAMYSHTLSAVDRFGVAKQKADIGVDGFAYLIDDKLYSKEAFQNAYRDKLSADEIAHAPSRLKHLYHPADLNVDAGDWQAPELAGYDISVKTHLQRVGASQTAMDFVGRANAAPPESISMLWEARRKAFSKLNSGGEYYQLTNGMDSLPNAMAAALESPVQFGKKAASVVQDADGVTVVCADGASYRGRSVIVTAPLPVMRTMDFAGGLSPRKTDAINSINYSKGTCVYFKVAKPYWEEDGLPASLWTDGPYGRVFKWKSAFGEYIWNFITGPVEAELHGKPDAYVYDFVRDGLAAARPSMKDALEPLFRFCWSTNPYSLGTFHYWGPGQAKFAGAFREPEGRIAFAGEHTMTMEMGMEAAMSSGLQAAFEVMDVI